MKGLALVLGKGKDPAAKLGPKPAPDPVEEPEQPETDASELEFARIASEASAAGDHDAAAEALVSAIKACMGSYGPEK